MDEDNVELDSRKKRLHTKAEADGAQAAPKAEAFHGQESEEDDDDSFISDVFEDESLTIFGFVAEILGWRDVQRGCM